MRFRRGDRTRSVGDGICLKAAHEVVIDHCSASWGNDEVISVSGANQTNITVQWCFITESLDDSFHDPTNHAYGTLLRTNGRVTFHHNLYAHHRTRCPRLGTYGQYPGLTADFRNNTIYNWIYPAGYSANDPVTANYVGNYLKPGPSTLSRSSAFQVGGQTTRLFVEGNFIEGLEVQPENPWDLVDKDEPENRLEKPVPAAPLKTDSAPVAFKRVLAEGGATRPVRDDVDKRIIRDVRKGLGNVINSQASVGGWPKYTGTCNVVDKDSDGLPDAWEVRNGLNPTLASDNRDDPDGDGYTNLEEWLNMTDPHEKDPGIHVW
jgi:pectate lyase